MDTTIIIGSDHGGYILKKFIIEYLCCQSFNIYDVGTKSIDSCDYPDFAFAVAQQVGNGNYTRGIVICTSGIGVTICANKVFGVRAALCATVEQAILSRKHNDANVLALGSSFVNVDVAGELCTAWLATDFDGGRHQKRVDKIHQFSQIVNERSLG